ncbi:UNVERIFIED_CONTAM: hypothetical protein PYX00_009214 [Menopon gallinae]|uniref:Ribosomal protein L33 n=1 Tax=Menopon gallinae TaxID=328185 RepID=A0AAW2HB33_9NEOP
MKYPYIAYTNKTKPEGTIWELSIFLRTPNQKDRVETINRKRSQEKRGKKPNVNSSVARLSRYGRGVLFSF